MLPVNYRHSIDNKGVLHVRQTHKPNDEGEYTCQIQGGQDKDTTTATTYISVVGEWLCVRNFVVVASTSGLNRRPCVVSASSVLRDSVAEVVEFSTCEQTSLFL